MNQEDMSQLHYYVVLRLKNACAINEGKYILSRKKLRLVLGTQVRIPRELCTSIIEEMIEMGYLKRLNQKKIEIL